MKESEAFEILGIPIHASIEEINTRFREIASRIHPDKGGDNHAMAELLFAREGAIRSVHKRNFEPVDVVKEFQRINTEVAKRADQREITKKISSKILSSRIGSYKRYMLIAAVLGVISGATTLAGTEIIVVIDVPVALTNLSAALTVFFTFMYLVSSSLADGLEQDIRELCDIIDHRSSYEALIHGIDIAFLKPQPWTENQLEDLIFAWFGSNSDELERIRSLATKIGETHFSRLLLSKGIELGVIREHAIVEDGRVQVGYSLKGVANPIRHRHAQS